MIATTYRLFVLAALMLLAVLSMQIKAEQVTNSTIHISELGSFKPEFKSVQVVDRMEIEQVLGEVAFKPKSSFKVQLPFTPRQISFLYHPGTKVNQGQKVAKIEGPEVHHFFDEIDASKSIYLKSKKHLESVQSYANSNTIKSAEWLDINKTYLEAKLNFEHLNHVLQQLATDNNGDIFLISPSNGLLEYADEQSPYLFEIIPSDNVFIKSLILTKKAENVTSFKTEQNCLLKVETVDEKVINHKQTVWSSLGSSCELKLGQQLLLTPILSIEGIKVPHQSLFELNDTSYVAVKNGQEINLVEIIIIGREDDNYIVQSDNLTEQAEVLASFVSIAQGLFLGLGE
ncbi:hypothetical protein tloyanaT_03490 [Thalassotalea loyana]|uniref:RND efflux pump membrane fusion protein barrel-sandwich domain-containing protein n=1 Tax=Thalassotalea loyana TaxID=280483 RepID=A0ABQ6H8X7_9GAMM|nr:hypothetical protein [Thalassotalea loyana]GLX84097.1 hypothetical protein tloyanaT_03490 [Thalassotalea loyana]